MKSLLIIAGVCFFSVINAQQKADDDLPKPISSREAKAPEFPGGIDAFNKLAHQNFNSKNVKCEAGNISAKINFTVDAKGNLIDVKAIGSNESLNKEAIRAVESVKEKWTPGSANNENVKSYFSLPFKLSCG